MISYLLNIILIGVLFPDFLERRFPNEFRNVVINMSYNFIYFYSKLQIMIMKYNTKLNIFIESNPSLLKFKNDVINILNKNTNVDVNQNLYIKNGLSYNKKIAEFDFYIINDFNTNKIKLCYDNTADEIFVDTTFKFILFEFLVSKNTSDEINTYRIDLKTDSFNYYVVDNKFTKSFFIFYVNYYLKVPLTVNESDVCTIRIIDHEINKVEYQITNKNETLLFEKNNYKLLPE